MAAFQDTCLTLEDPGKRCFPSAAAAAPLPSFVALLSAGLLGTIIQVYSANPWDPCSQNHASKYGAVPPVSPVFGGSVRRWLVKGSEQDLRDGSVRVMGFQSLAAANVFLSTHLKVGTFY